MSKKKLFLLLSLLPLCACVQNTSSSVTSVKSSSEESAISDKESSNTTSSLTSEVTTSNNISSTSSSSSFDGLKGDEYFASLKDKDKKLLSASGYVENKIGDFKQYVNTDAYKKVSTAKEFLDALKLAKYEYTSTYNETSKEVEQTLTKEGNVHVIEITNDLDLGYKTLQKEGCDLSLVNDFASKADKLRPYLYMSTIVDTYGISQIKIENTSNLLIYSKNGSKILHAGFKLTSDTNVVIRNLAFDEIWQWEDAIVDNASQVGDYDYFGWAYFKISFSEYIWIDHCSFGKSYDGQIDYSNPVYNNAQTAFRAPYGAKGGNGLHISYCSFNAGSDDKNGYIYKMMSEIEEDYLHGTKKNLMYKYLRDKGITFEEILYGIAMPQKKGFLCGDSGDGEVEYTYNLSLNVSFAYCTFKNLEDRLPKLRGGNAYMYNCVVDSMQYYSYRQILKDKGGKFTTSKFKNALVSQGVLCGNGGSIKLENSIYRGIEQFLKNNDSSSADKVKGGYSISNCIYQKNSSTAEIKGSSDVNNPFTTSGSSLTTDYFSWHTENKLAPFTPTLLEVDTLEKELNDDMFKSGTNYHLQEYFLSSNY